MALVWAHTAGSQRYEIRTAGRSVRLYTNGVLHSQYHPERTFGGGVWDLLGLPALWRDPPRLSGILLLGLGGGAVVRQLHELVEWDRLVAVERNPVHLDVSRRFFGLDRIDAELVELDARSWVRSRAAGRFDLIIDDLFSDSGGEAARAVPFTRQWYRRLRGLLAEDGILVVNFPDGRELERMLNKVPALKRDFDSIYKFTIPAYGNAVAALLRDGRSPSDLARAVAALRPRRRTARLRYHIQRVFP